MNTIQLLATLQRAWRSRRRMTRSARPRRLVWALALAGVATHTLGPWAGQAHAASPLPTGLNVVRGQATVVQSGNQLTVNNSAGAVLNWQSFNIGAANVVRFEQPSAASKVLNRVVGSDPSQIFGQLSSNGEVWLVNPYGVLFGRDARVNVGSLVVSTLNIGNDDWRAGRFSLSGGAGATASIVNQGELRSSTGGRVLLLGGAGGVRNEGLIAAPDGQVALAAGASVDLADGLTRNVAVRVQAPQGEVLNLGSLAAGGGRVDLVAAMVNQQGFVRAESLSGSGGEIVLQGSQGVNLAAGSVTSAAGAGGGHVQVDGGSGTTMLAGEVNVTGSAGQGGDALLLGRQVGLLDGALVDASGSTGGGRVRVGGGLQGHDASVTNARAVYMGPGMQIRADATGSGDGGTIVLWSDEATRAYGTLSARGGADGGNGGFIETSGGWLDARPASVRTDAAHGKAGRWLLDPNNLLITGDISDTGVSGYPDFTTTEDSAVLSDFTISSALQAGNNVTITTGSGGKNLQAGDISMSFASINVVGGQPVSLTITAAGNISVTNSTIQSSPSALNAAPAAPLNVTLNAGSSGIGSIQVFESSILTHGGNIKLGGATQAQGPNVDSARPGAVAQGVDTGDGITQAIGVNLRGSTLDAGSGNVSIAGQALPIGGGGVGVQVIDGFNANPTQILGHDIDIYGWVDGDNADLRRGVYLNGPLSSIVASHGLTITGVASSGVYQPSAQTFVQPIGVSIQAGSVSVSPPAVDKTAFPFLSIDGSVNEATATGSGALRLGVSVTGQSPTITASNGASVSIVGHDLLDEPGNTASMVLGSDATLNFGSAGPIGIQGNTRVGLNGNFTAPTGDTFTAVAGDGLFIGGSINGDPSAVNLSGRDVSLGGFLVSGILVGANAPSAVTLSASRNVDITNSFIESNGAPVTINILAAAGGSGAGTVSLNNVSILSNGGDITLGGGSVAVGPNLTSPLTGAVATNASVSDAGVSIIDSTVDAFTGKLSIVGQSTRTSSNTWGVYIATSGESSTFLGGGDIDIRGWVDSNGDVARTGVLVDQASSIAATHSLTINGLANSSVFSFGLGAPVGVEIQGAVSLIQVLKPAPSPVLPGGQLQLPVAQGQAPASSFFTITGTTNDGLGSDGNATRYGVLIGNNATLAVGLGATVAITGVDQSPNGEIALSMHPSTATFTSAGDVSIVGQGRADVGTTMVAPTGQALLVQSSSNLFVSGLTLTGAPKQATFSAAGLLGIDGSVSFSSAAPVTLHATEVDLGFNAPFSLTTNGTIRVLTDSYVTDQATTLTSFATGTAIAVAGADGLSNTAKVSFATAPASLKTLFGRSLIYLVDDSIPDTGLDFQFRQYGTTYPTEPVDTTLNGLVYAQTVALTLVNTTAITKAYDGTNAVTTPGVGFALTGFRPGQSQNSQIGTLSLAYPGTAVGDNQLLSVGGYSQVAVSDSGERAVYGYTTQFNVRGDITRRPLTLAGTTAADKVYDGSRNAALSGGSLSNLVAGESLSLAYSGALFDTANAGIGKTVSGAVALADGSGLASNYQLAQTAVSTTAKVTPRPLTLSGVTAADKVYDGTLATTVSVGAAPLVNLVAGETLGLVLSGGQFDTVNVGSGKLVSGTAALQDGSGLASNYSLAGTFSATASVTPRPLTLTGVIVGSKIYDGGANADLSGGTLGNLVAGETLVLGLNGGQFSDANAGLGKAVTITTSISNGSGLASNYLLPNGGVIAATGDIMQRLVSLNSLQANGKVYDGNRNAVVTGGNLIGLLEGENLGLSFANSQFLTAGVGTNKAINTNVTLLNGNGGLASNYNFVPAEGPYASNAAVTPAGLLYVANPASFTAGQALGALSGSVTGFVAGDTQATATTGTLLFSTAAGATSGPGSYAITGSGLSATNYTFAQAPANATALSLVAPPTVAQTVGLPEIDDTQRNFRQALPPLPRGPEGTRTLDALQSMRVDATWLSMSFGELDLSSMSREEIAALLEARRQYKMSVLAVGRDKLSLDPSLADVPACQTVRQSESGRCLVTAELLAAVDERGEAASIEAPGPAPASAPAVAPVPRPTVTPPAPPVAAATPAAPAPQPAPAPVANSAPALATLPAPAVEARTPPRVRVAAHPTLQAPPLPAARPVRSASIPQIQRKIAVLVGIDNYVDERIPSLDNAGRDVDAVARVLEQRLGYETIVVRDAGREAMVGLLNKLALQVRPNDSVVVYYAGHGTVIDETAQGYWIPSTADAEKPETWLSNRDIGRLLGSLRASQVVLISDSCFSGSLVGDKRIKAGASTADPRALLQRRATLVMSSGGDEPVADGARNGHSPFSNSLMATLQGLDNWNAGGNLFEHIREDVTKRLPQTPRYGPARDTRFVEGADYLFEQRQLGQR